MAEQTSPGDITRPPAWSLLRARTHHIYHCKMSGTSISQQLKLTTQAYGISLLSFAVCDGVEYAVKDKQFFLPGRLVTFKCE